MSADFPSGVRFECTGCGLCCKDVPGHRRRILILGSEMAGIEKASGLSRAKFARASRTTGRYGYRMKKAGGSCVFLGKDGRCSIYSARPTICRFFPFELLEGGAWRAFECEGIGRGGALPKRYFASLVGRARRAWDG